MSSQRVLSLSIKNNLDVKYWLSILAVFVVTFLAFIPFTHLGLDVVDMGYHLANQDLANHLGIQYIKVTPVWWLSDILGGWWLRLAEGQSFWWARMGGNFILALSGAIAASTLFQIYKPAFYIVLFVILATLLRFSNSWIIHYYTVPTLFYAVFCLSFIKLNLDPKRTLFQVISGISLAFLVFSRLPMIATFSLPFLCLLVCYRMEKERFHLFKEAYFKMLCATLSVFVVFAFYLHSQGLLKDYVFFQSISKYHSLSWLVDAWMRQIPGKIPLMIFLLGLGPSLFFFVKRGLLSRRTLKYTLPFLLACAMAAIGIFREVRIHIWPDTISLYLIMVMLNVVCFYLLRKENRFPDVVLLILSVSFPLLRNVGSTSGFHGLIANGSMLHCGLTAIWLFRVGALYKCKVSTTALSSFLFIVFSAKALVLLANYEAPMQKLSSNLQCPRLDGIYTTPERAKNFLSMVDEVGKHTKKGDRILAYPIIPMVYFATNTLPLGNTSWLDLLDLQPLSDKLDSISEMEPPVLIVRAKMDSDYPESRASSFGWPLTADLLKGWDLEEKCSLFDEKIMKKWDMKLVWSNDCFNIYLPSDLSPIHE